MSLLVGFTDILSPFYVITFLYLAITFVFYSYKIVKLTRKSPEGPGEPTKYVCMSLVRRRETLVRNLTSVCFFFNGFVPEKGSNVILG